MSYSCCWKAGCAGNPRRLGTVGRRARAERPLLNNAIIPVALTTPRIGGNRPRRPVCHFKRSCDLSSLTSSAAHSRASGTFPASLKARAFAKAWLRADRSAADSFPGPCPLGVTIGCRRAAHLRLVQRFRRTTNLGRQRSRPQRLSVPATPVPLSRMLAETAAELATARPVEKLRLRLRAELLRSLPAPSRPGSVSIERRT
jgi:hypothetical protein